MPMKYNDHILTPQHGTFWCIPAAIETGLGMLDISSCEQEFLVLKHLQRQFGLKDEDVNQDLLEKYRCAPLPNAGYGTLEPVAKSIVNAECQVIDFKHVTGLDTTDKYISAIRQNSSQDSVVLISRKNPDGNSHMNVVLSVEGDDLVLYDPGCDKVSTEPAKSVVFSNDLLAIAIAK